MHLLEETPNRHTHGHPSHTTRYLRAWALWKIREVPCIHVPTRDKKQKISDLHSLTGHGEIQLYKPVPACQNIDNMYRTTCLGKFQYSISHSRRNASGAKHQALRAKQSIACKETKQRCSLLHQDNRKGQKPHLQQTIDPTSVTVVLRYTQFSCRESYLLLGEEGN